MNRTIVYKIVTLAEILVISYNVELDQMLSKIKKEDRWSEFSFFAPQTTL